MKLSIIIPTYNEERTIKEIISKVKKVKLASVTKEILVVDDGSTDRTSKILSSISGIKRLTHKRNQGKGAALRTGFNNADGDIILVQDADLEYDPADYVRLVKPILAGRAKVVYGSRLKNYPLHIAGSKKTPLITHYIGNKALTFITNVLYGDGITDMETCYKVFKKDVLKDIEITSNRFEFEPEITAKILKKGYKIFEVPIKVSPRGYDEGKKISWRDGLGALWTLIKYRFSN